MMPNVNPVPDRPGWSFGTIVRGSSPEEEWTEVPLRFYIDGTGQARTVVLRMAGRPAFREEIIPAAQAFIDEAACAVPPFDG